MDLERYGFLPCLLASRDHCFWAASTLFLWSGRVRALFKISSFNQNVVCRRERPPPSRNVTCTVHLHPGPSWSFNFRMSRPANSATNPPGQRLSSSSSSSSPTDRRHNCGRTCCCCPATLDNPTRSLSTLLCCGLDVGLPGHVLEFRPPAGASTRGRGGTALVTCAVRRPTRGSARRGGSSLPVLPIRTESLANELDLGRRSRMK